MELILNSIHDCSLIVRHICSLSESVFVTNQNQGAAIWLPGAYAPDFFEKSEQIKNLSKKFEKKSCTYLTMARTNV
jgi:hypothetical protein